MKREVRKKQLLLILCLSVMVIACLAGESWRRSMPDRKTDIVQKVKETGQQEEQKEQGEQKKTTKKEKAVKETKVRVLLKTNNFASYFHSTVRVTSAKPFIVSIDGKKKEYKAGSKVGFSAGDGSLKKKKIMITPKEGAKLKVLSITRQHIHPSYRHTLRIFWNKNGLLLVNKLPLEEYLYAVVPSEISTGNKMDALKAQAICARSFTYRQMESDKYKKYHADLDDSVACQVYNNVPEDKRSRKAVESTRGKVLTDKKGAVVLTYYYSTSWGYSASGQDVWNTSSKISYLKENLQITEKSRKKSGIRSLDLSTEESFAGFMRNAACDTYDSDSAWYRWDVTISQKSLSARIDGLLASCYASNPEFVLTQKSDGSYAKALLKPMGKIDRIRVEKRERSGLVTELVFVGKKNVVKVCTQYNIRKVLAPLYEQIYYNNGNSTTTMSLLPSAAFYVSTGTKDNKAVFRLIGGGFGHGAGMSQCGAARMAKLGKDYREILAHYFAGTAIKNVSKLKHN